MGKILRVAIRRSVNAAITIFGIICLNYVLIRLMPGDPNLSLAPRNRQFIGLVEYNRQLFGLDKSPLDQFLIYLRNTVTLDWGYSYFYKQPVADLLFRDFGWTLLLVGTSTVFTIIIGMVVGSYAAAKRGKPFDLASTGLGIFFYGMPIFWLGIVLQAAFARTSPLSQYFSWWPVLPSQGYIDPPPFPQIWSWDLLHIGSVIIHLKIWLSGALSSRSRSSGTIRFK